MLMVVSTRIMTTTKAPPILMPCHHFTSVKDLFYETKMSNREFYVLKMTVRLNALKYLDTSGLVPVEMQDPIAFRQFLDMVKISDPTIPKRYPYLWPVLAYLELYLVGRRRSYISCNFDVATMPPFQHRFSHRAPIYIRYSHSVKTGQPLREIAEVEFDRLSYRLSRPAHRRVKHLGPVVENCCRKTITVTDLDIDENVPAVVVDDGPVGSCHTPSADPVGGCTPPVATPASERATPAKSFWWSLGSSIGNMCGYVVNG